ncbi:Gfo/Idh/MocA family oxidoreductase, partial [Candidatus Sumerlaeota bacterium]|nr:Gfo/Idh/MocA family oxidoreductase [Candidatus Sumerlaeota bacterium]
MSKSGVPTYLQGSLGELLQKLTYTPRRVDDYSGTPREVFEAQHFSPPRAFFCYPFRRYWARLAADIAIRSAPRSRAVYTTRREGAGWCGTISKSNNQGETTMEKDLKETGKKVSRRSFILTAAAAGVTVTQGCGSFHILPRHILGGKNYVSPNEKMNIGSIGVGGKGFSDMEGVSSENIVAICDVDWKLAEKAFKAQPKAKRYYDYREMIEKEKLDAVIVSTPDHTHAPASVFAMQRGLHVYCQKPLTHDVYEARIMRKTAEKYGVVTQMGNQGTAEDGLRSAVEIIRSGAIGKIKEIHVWTNRPIWPQGLNRPDATPPVPEGIKWDLWLGSAPQRPYNPAYHPFNWRGWWDFGTGALGDMACHTANMAFMACDLEYPDRIEAETSERFAETPPKWSVIKYNFPARGNHPPCTFHWYDGGKMPPKD